MNNKFSRSVFSTFVIAVLMMAFVNVNESRFAAASAQNVTAQTSGNPLAMLPQSDAVLAVEMRRLLNEALPRVLGDSPKLAEINADIDSFRQRTGISARDFERVAVGASYTSPSPGITRMEPVAIASGRFNAGQIVAAGRLAANGRYQEQRHNGRTIYVFNLNEQIRLFGVLNMRVSEIAVTELNSTTLAIGDLARVRAAIDVAAGRGARISPELIAMVTRNENALMSFGGSVPVTATRGLDIGNEEIERTVASIRQVYGHLGQTTSGFDMMTMVRTETADQARVLNDNLTALRPIANFAIGQMTGRREALGRLAQNALDSLRITHQANEVQIRLEVAQTDIATVVRGL